MYFLLPCPDNTGNSINQSLPKTIAVDCFRNSHPDNRCYMRWSAHSMPDIHFIILFGISLKDVFPLQL